MGFAIDRLIRVSLLGLVVASAAAVELSRLPPPPTRRVASPGHYVQVEEFRPGWGLTGSLWVDVNTGARVRLPEPRPAIFGEASASPWTGDDGRGQVVGRWFGPDGRASWRYGLARRSFPDGARIDWLESEVFPLGAPCWAPGPGALVLFAGLDGGLHRADFEPANREGTASGGTIRPLGWRTGAPSRAFVFRDPCWPTMQGFERIVLVSLREDPGGPPLHSLTKCRPTWLRLSPGADTIEEQGPLLLPSAVPQSREIRHPRLGHEPGGGFLLAYLSGEDDTTYDLYLTRLELDAGGRPRPAGPGNQLAGGCLVSFPPTFSDDGRWITVLQQSGSGAPTVRRLAVSTSTCLKTPG